MRIHFNLLFHSPPQVEIEMALSQPPTALLPRPLSAGAAVVVHDPEDERIQKLDPSSNDSVNPNTTAFAHVFGLNFVSPGIPVLNPHHPAAHQFYTSSPPSTTPSRKQSPYKVQQPLINGSHARLPIPGDQQRGISYYDRVDRPKISWVVPTFVLIHVTMFTITMYENNCPGTSGRPDKCVLQFLNRLSFQPLSENPLLGPSYRSLLLMGALESNLVTKGKQGWRLLTCVWLHAGLFHLFANMTGLLSLGIRLEKDFGGMRVGIIYIMAGFGGSLLSALFMQNQISVGASGALMGLLGATVAEIFINWTTYSHRSRSLAALVLAMTLTFSFGLMPHVDNFAHIGGFIAGALLGLIFLMRPRFAWIKQRCCFPMIHDEDLTIGGENGPGVQARNMKHTRLQIIIWSLALAFLLLGYTAAILSLFKGLGLYSRRTCKWCHYMSCVPSYLWRCRSSVDQRCTIVKSSMHGSLRMLCSKTNVVKDWPAALNATDVEIRALCTRTCASRGI